MRTVIIPNIADSLEKLIDTTVKMTLSYVEKHVDQETLSAISQEVLLSIAKSRGFDSYSDYLLAKGRDEHG